MRVTSVNATGDSEGSSNRFGSVVVGFVHSDGALLPIGRRLQTVLRQAALVDEITAATLASAATQV